jgi:hypothetical protein
MNFWSMSARSGSVSSGRAAQVAPLADKLEDNFPQTERDIARRRSHGPGYKKHQYNIRHTGRFFNNILVNGINFFSYLN